MLEKARTVEASHTKNSALGRNLGRGIPARMADWEGATPCQQTMKFRAHPEKTFTYKM